MYKCHDCGNLDKSIKKKGNHSYSYGCNAKGMDYGCGWIRNDKELKWMGCSNWIPKPQPMEQISLFDLVI